MLWQLKKYYICLHVCVYVCVRALVVEVEWVHTHAMCMEAREKLPDSFLCHLGPWIKFRSSSWVAIIFLLSHLKCSLPAFVTSLLIYFLFIHTFIFWESDPVFILTRQLLYHWIISPSWHVECLFYPERSPQCRTLVSCTAESLGSSKVLSRSRCSQVSAEWRTGGSGKAQGNCITEHAAGL